MNQQNRNYINLIVGHLNRLTTLAQTYKDKGDLVHAQEIRDIIAENSNVNPHDTLAQEAAILKLNSIN